MNNPFQEQLLKAGLVSEQQVKQVQKDKQKKHRQVQGKKKNAPSEAQLKAQQEAQKLREEKAQRDRELNKRKEDQARGKAISAEINQMILDNLITRDQSCEIAYNFEHQKKVKRIYVNADMKDKVIKGVLGIARIEGRYELVPASIAEKIKQRNEKRVVIFDAKDEKPDENDPYAEYEVPDDLVW